MASILVTGAYGLVGRPLLSLLLERGHSVQALDLQNHATARHARRFAARFPSTFRARWADVRDMSAVERAVEGAECVIHLAAMIPPEADKHPREAWAINVGGTRNLVIASKRAGSVAHFVFASSIATYGDRIKAPLIRLDDPLEPNGDDAYACHKVEAEAFLRDSGLNHTVLRLSAIMSHEKLTFDPILFRMPLSTSLEICDPRDAALAFANAALNPEAYGKTFLIAGGPSCRTSFGSYIDWMLRLMGLGGAYFLPSGAFSQKGYHCAFMDTEESQRVLRYQTRSLIDHYKDVRRAMRLKRIAANVLRGPIQASIIAMSPYLEQGKAKKPKGILAALLPKAMRA